MAKLAYILGAYQNYRTMTITFMVITAILTPLLCIWFDEMLGWGYKEDEPEVIWLKRVIKISALLFVFNLLSVVCTPTTSLMEEIIIEKAAKMETNTKSNDELRLYFNNIIGHNEEEEDKK